LPFGPKWGLSLAQQDYSKVPTRFGHRQLGVAREAVRGGGGGARGAWGRSSFKRGRLAGDASFCPFPALNGIGGLGAPSGPNGGLRRARAPAILAGGRFSENPRPSGLSPSIGPRGRAACGTGVMGGRGPLAVRLAGKNPGGCRVRANMLGGCPGFPGGLLSKPGARRPGGTWAVSGVWARKRPAIALPSNLAETRPI